MAVKRTTTNIRITSNLSFTTNTKICVIFTTEKTIATDLKTNTKIQLTF